MKLTPLGKLVGMVVGLVILGFVGAAGAAATRPHEQEWRCVQVAAGDTLWELASGSGSDVRAEMHRIARTNGLRDASIQPGQHIWVPADGRAAGRAVQSEACPRVR
ncbi:MAG TPA: LysM peptidoglycan-binding domain-containing protein [Actinomycetota bacterium]|nr:LysM peptidoglycan-binding domain-containing protein [Actinomycetota bacterium]